MARLPLTPPSGYAPVNGIEIINKSSYSMILYVLGHPRYACRPVAKFNSSLFKFSGFIFI